jgi:hypothetical protein
MVEKQSGVASASPLLGDDEFGWRIDAESITVGMLHDFLLDMDPDFGRDFVGGLGDG